MLPIGRSPAIRVLSRWHLGSFKGRRDRLLLQLSCSRSLPRFKTPVNPITPINKPMPPWCLAPTFMRLWWSHRPIIFFFTFLLGPRTAPHPGCSGLSGSSRSILFQSWLTLVHPRPEPQAAFTQPCSCLRDYRLDKLDFAHPCSLNSTHYSLFVPYVPIWY